MIRPVEGRRPLRRSTINNRIRRIRTVFRWGVSVELVPPEVLVALKSVPGLRRGEISHLAETPKVIPPTGAEVEAVAAELSPTVAPMVRVQLLAGMRPIEVCEMPGADIDRSGDVWRYEPASHKTENHGSERVILPGPRAQTLLAPYLKADPTAFLLTPGDAVAETKASKRAAAEARRRERGEIGAARPNQARSAVKTWRRPSDTPRRTSRWPRRRCGGLDSEVIGNR